MAIGEEEFGGVRVHVELEVGGNDFEVAVNKVFGKDGVAGLIVKVAAPSHTWVYSWQRAVGGRGAVFFTVFMIEDKIEGWDGGVVGDFRHGSGVIGRECGEARFWVEVFFQPLELLLGESGQRRGLG